MKKLLALALGISLLGVFGAQAEEKKDEKKPLTEEQKKFRKEMLTKYDTDKDGKLSKEEKEKVSADDKKKMKEMHGGKDGEKKEKK
jgi:hypothetical protein